MNTALELRPRGVGDILDAGFRLYRRHFWTLVGIVAVVAVPVATLTTVIEGVTTENAFDVDEETVYTDEGAYIAGQVVIGILGFVTYALATAACFQALSSSYLGEEVVARESLRTALRKLPSLLWLSILLVVVVAAGFILLVIPGIYLAVAVAVAVPVLMFEDRRGGKAISRSMQLVRKRWWATFGAIAVAYIAVIVLSALLGLLLGGLLLVDVGSDVFGGFLFALVEVVVTVFTTPLVAAVLTLVYYDLRIRKEGVELQQELGRVIEEPAATQPPVGPSGFLPPQPPSSG